MATERRFTFALPLNEPLSVNRLHLWANTGQTPLLEGQGSDPTTSGGFTAAFGAEPPAQVVALARHFLRNVMGKSGSTQDRQGADYF